MQSWPSLIMHKPSHLTVLCTWALSSVHLSASDVDFSIDWPNMSCTVGDPMVSLNFRAIWVRSTTNRFKYEYKHKLHGGVAFWNSWAQLSCSWSCKPDWKSDAWNVFWRLIWSGSTSKSLKSNTHMYMPRLTEGRMWSLKLRLTTKMSKARLVLNDVSTFSSVSYPVKTLLCTLHTHTHTHHPHSVVCSVNISQTSLQIYVHPQLRSSLYTIQFVVHCMLQSFMGRINLERNWELSTQWIAISTH